MIGEIISQFKIEKKIGEGGMGVVYKAQDTKLDRAVALKFLPESLTPTEEDRKRFIREAKAAAALNHPNICTIHNIDEYDGNQFIVMEYVEGKTLKTKIEAGDLTLSTALNYGSKIAEALAEAHQNNIIHRDIKPENIMVNANGHIKVMDFGLAKLKHTHDITKTGSTIGTLGYMSPEQIQGKAVDHRSDLFSFGIVLYEMLTGSKPFRGEHEAAMTYAIVNEEPASIQTYLPEVSDELIEFFDKILAKEPEERFGNAAEVVELLEEVKKSADIIPQQSPPAEAETESKVQDSDSPKTISLTIPNFETEFKGKVGFLVSAAGILVLVLTVVWWFMSASNPSTEKHKPGITDRSIAVLPFANLSESEDATSITRGLHDDLLTRLSNIADLKVTSRTSVERYRDTELSLPAIADSLNVNWIVEGGVQEAGGQVQVRAKLINPHRDENVWGDQYQQQLTAENLFAIQEEIAEKIASALQAELTEGEQERIEGAPTQDLEAYRFYVQGRTALDQATPPFSEDLRKAGELFRKALEEDSTYALAWAGLADAVGRGLFEYYNPDTLRLPEVSHEEAARKALDLDPDLAEAHAALGNVYYQQQKGPAALQVLKEAIELKPSLAQAYHLLGQTFLVLGRPDRSLEHLELAEELNPNHWWARHLLYDVYIVKDQYEKALEEVHKQQRMAPEWISSLYAEFRVLYKLGRYKEAHQVAQKGLSLVQQYPVAYQNGWLSYLTVIESAMGDTTQAKKHLKKLQVKEASPIQFAYANAALGNIDAAIEEFNKIDDWGWVQTLTLRYTVFPDEMNKIRNHPQYKELIREVNSYWGLNPDGSIPEINETM